MEPNLPYFAALFSVVLAALVGCCLFTGIAPKGPAKSVGEFGRKWASWMALVSTIGILPEAITKWDLEPVFRWMVGTFVFGSAAFAFGSLYGFMSIRRTSKPTNEILNAPLGDLEETRVRQPCYSGNTTMKFRPATQDAIFRYAVISGTALFCFGFHYYGTHSPPLIPKEEGRHTAYWNAHGGLKAAEARLTASLNRKPESKA